MKKLGLVLMTAAFVLGSGFLKKNEDGSYSADTAELSKQADAVAKDASSKTKEAAAAITVKTDEIMADCNKSVEDMKQKLATMKKDHLLAYTEKYKTLLAGKTDEINAVKQQIKNLKWTEKFGAKSKELKGQLSEYKGQYDALKEKYDLYVGKLKGMGVDLSAYGL